MKGLFSYDDARKTVQEIVAMHLFEFTITKRDLVNGPNLMLKEIISKQSEEDSLNEIKYGFIKPKIEQEPTPKLDSIQEPFPTPEPIPEPIQEIKPLESEIPIEKLSAMIGGKLKPLKEELYFAEKKEVKEVKNEIIDAKEALDRMDEILREPEDLGMFNATDMESELVDKGDFEDKLEKSKEKDISLPPPVPSAPTGPPAGPPAGPPKSPPSAPGSAPSPPPPGSGPKSPQTLRGGMTEELKDLFSKTKEEKVVEPPIMPPASPPAPKMKPISSPESVAESAPKRRDTISELSSRKSVPSPSPSPPPPELEVTSASSKSFSFKQKKKAKKMGARMRSVASDTEETALS